MTDWLEFRETNLSLLEGLRKAGYANTVKNLARMVGYKPKSKRFFEVLGWKQKQAAEGHRSIGLTDLEIRKLTFEGLSEKEICEKIVAEKLGWKQVMGMLPKAIGLTPAIFVALLDQFSGQGPGHPDADAGGVRAAEARADQAALAGSAGEAGRPARPQHREEHPRPGDRPATGGLGRCGRREGRG